jgi:hypothetical protein
MEDDSMEANVYDRRKANKSKSEKLDNFISDEEELSEEYYPPPEIKKEKKLPNHMEYVKRGSSSQSGLIAMKGSQDSKKNDGLVDPQEEIMNKYYKAASKPSQFTQSIVLKPCGIMGFMFISMLIMFLIAQSFNSYEMRIPKLFDFINQDNADTLIFRQNAGANWLFSIDEKLRLQTIPLQIIKED